MYELKRDPNYVEPPARKKTFIECWYMGIKGKFCVMVKLV